jgi:hypothetical protein
MSRTPPIKFYPSRKLVQQLDVIASRLQGSRSHLISSVLEAFVNRDYKRMSVIHDLCNK